MGGIGIGAIIPLFSFVANKQSDSTDNISRAIENFFGILHLEYNLTTLIVLISLLFIIKAAFTFFASYISAKITADYEREMRNTLFKKTLGASWPYLLEQKVGHLETILITDTSKSSGILDLLSGAILISTSLLAYSFVAINISVAITLVTLGSGVVLFFILKPLLYKIRKISQRWADSSKLVTSQVSEYIIGSKTIKTLAVENRVIAKIQKHFDELREARVKLVVYGSLQTSFQEPVSLILIAGLFAFSYLSPGFQFASFIAVIYLVQKMFSFMQSIQGRLNGINETVPFLKAVTDYEERTSHFIENSGNNSIKFKFNESVRFNNIRFSYANNKDVLSDVSFEIRKGETVGLIGPSGTGKTTLADLLLKLFRPTEGKILTDGIDVSDIDTHSWRSNIGYVSQDIFLLSDTIRNNIGFYDPNISDRDIEVAAKMANIYDVIQEQPDKLSSVVGERGLKLSAGQRQRIVLARALVHKPKILVLDEATSALDNESEALIQKALENLKGKITILIIAHRLSTVMNCDKLIALENGKIVEQGSPRELLMDKNSYFYKTYNTGKD